mmetsp:Transcript_97644/g.188301  ORF Transcript_97644/g.188301 Transcript_97644/m.188301 type:complete len:253 (+) Transcript_97644:55-813(+)
MHNTAHSMPMCQSLSTCCPRCLGHMCRRFLLGCRRFLHGIDRWDTRTAAELLLQRAPQAGGNELQCGEAPVLKPCWLLDGMRAANAILDGRGENPEMRSMHRAEIGNRYLVGSFDDACEILDGGDAAAGIVAVVNLYGGKACETVVQGPLSKLGISYLGVDAEDIDLYPLIANHLDTVQNFMAGLPKQGKVFIHCFEGRNRSAAMCVALLLVEEQWTLKSALEHMVKKRPIALTNASFVEQLVVLAHDRHLL